MPPIRRMTAGAPRRSKRVIISTTAAVAWVLGCASPIVQPGSRAPLPADTPTSTSETALEKRAHELINRHRVSRKLAPLLADPRIADIAREHSRAMASGRRPFGHDDFDSRSAALLRFMNPRSIAENVAYDSRPGPNVAIHVVEGWIESRGHLQNIEGDFTHTGVGVAQDRGGVRYFTQIFVRID